MITAKDRLIAGIMELTEERLLQALPSNLLSEWLDVLAVFVCLAFMRPAEIEDHERD